MDKKSTETKQQLKAQEFKNQASQEQHGIVAEFVDFLAHNKKWWLTPIIAVFLLVWLLVVLGGTGPAQFIYTLY